MKNFLCAFMGLLLSSLLLMGAQARSTAHPASIQPAEDSTSQGSARDTTGLLITQVSTQQPCPGGSMLVYFSTAKPTPDSTTFTAELVTDGAEEFTVAVPVRGKASPLELTLPAALPIGTYRLRLRSATARIGGQYANRIIVNSPTTARLSGTTVIRRGEPAGVDLDIFGTGPITVHLSDGTSLALEGRGRLIAQTVNLYPTTTTTYSITGLSSGCSTGSFSGTAQVTVLPSIRIDSLSSYRVCGGDTIQAYLSVDSLAADDNPAHWSFLIGQPTHASGNLASYTGIGKVLSIRGRVMTVVLPRPSEGDMYSGVYAVQLSHVDPAAERGQYSVVHNRLVNIGTAPKATLPGNYSTDLDAPQGINLLVGVTGGRDYELTLSDGSVKRVKTDEQFYSQFARFDLFVNQSTTYTVQSVRNSCGVGTAEGQVTVNVRNPDVQALYLKKPDSLYCPGSLLKIDFGASGMFADTNQFRLELSDGLGNFYDNYVDTVRAGAHTVEFRVPEEPSYYRLRLVATNPAIVSNETGFYVSDGFGTSPKATVSITASDNLMGYATGQTAVVLPGAPTEVAIGFTGQPPFRYELSDGTVGQTTTNFVSFRRYPQTTTTFTVKSLTSSCGTGLAGSSATAVVQPFLLRIGSVSGIVCVGNELAVPVSTAGHVPEGVTYVVQAAADSATGIYRNLPTTGTLPALRIRIDADMLGKSQFLRVVANVGSLTYASAPTASQLLVRSAPSVRLTGPGGQTAVLIDSNQPNAELRVGGPTNDAFSLLLNDGRLLDSYTNGSVYVTPSSTTATSTYSIQSVYNTCGYGTAEGSVRVGYKPGLRDVQVSASELCAGKPWGIKYERVGELAADSRLVFSLRDSNGQNTKLGESTAVTGELSLPVPAIQKAGSYSLHVEATSPGLTLLEAGPAVNVRALATATVNAPANIMKGDMVPVTIALTGTAPWSFTLSGPEGEKAITTDTPSYALRIAPDTSVAYQVTHLADSGCGTGLASSKATITVTLLTASEPVLPLSVSVYPNPTSQYLHISGQWSGGQPVGIQLIDAGGRPVLNQSVERSRLGGPGNTFEHDLDLNTLPTGTYLLRLQVGDRTDVRRVVKH